MMPIINPGPPDLASLLKPIAMSEDDGREITQRAQKGCGQAGEPSLETVLLILFCVSCVFSWQFDWLAFLAEG